MERLLHYAWLHRLYTPLQLRTTDGREVEVLDPGLWNRDAGPDFFNAKIRIDRQIWVGNIEIHRRSSDWIRHRHHQDPAYNNVILHVCEQANQSVRTSDGQEPPQVEIRILDQVRDNYAALLAEAAYPPCYRIIPQLPSLIVHSWLSALTAERLEEKTERIGQYLHRTSDYWERAFFVALARNFGFGVNADAFEEWAFTILPQQVGKHRDNLFQVEAYFFGQAGLLAEDTVPPDRRDAYFVRLQKEYDFLRNKFNLTPLPASRWKFLRLRPQNFPTVRLAQLAQLYHSGRLNFSLLLEAETLADYRKLLSTHATEYWQSHFTFGHISASSAKQLGTNSRDLICINTVAPLLFAYGRKHGRETYCERAVSLLEAIAVERNHITRTWEEVGLTAEHAADSQALIHLKTHYCDRKDCLRCRFGSQYLKRETL
ncbi:MAG: DUF2851 family protein [Alloprevotella sp.]|nr:DUF2851 family protein [Alloprevotella sp.]